jgi:hypothetical protein
VLLVLSLAALPYADTAGLSGVWNWTARSGVPAAAIQMPAGFFAASMRRGRTRPHGLVAVVFAGAIVLAAGLASLGIGLLTQGETRGGWDYSAAARRSDSERRSAAARTAGACIRPG